MIHRSSILLIGTLVGLFLARPAMDHVHANLLSSPFTAGGGGLTPDNTACLAPGTGSFSTGPPPINGTFTILSNGCTMTTKYGTWTWDGMLFDPSGNDGEQNGAWQLKLNGVIAARALSIYVACGGNMFFMDADQNIWAFTANVPYSRIVASPLSAFPACGSISPALDALPTVAPTGFTPSTDGTNFTCPGGGTANSREGAWTCGPTCTVDCQGVGSFDMLLNGIRVDGFDGVKIEINSGGHAFVQHQPGNFNVYLGYNTLVGSTSLAPGPIVVGTVNNANAALSNQQQSGGTCISGPTSTRSIPCILHTVSITACTADPCDSATVAATPVFTMSSGGFTGTIGVLNVTECPAVIGGGVDTTSLFRVPLTGANAGKLMFNRALVIGDADGLAKECQIEPTQNGSQFDVLAQVYFNMVVK